MSVAYLIPAFNEERVIEGTIAALKKSGAALSDIYVVDDHSTDDTSRLARRMGVNVYRCESNGGKARAQSTGLYKFRLQDRYEWVVFLDGDSKVDPSFVSVLRNSLDPKLDLIVGRVCSVRNSHIFSASRAFDYSFGHSLHKKAQDNAGVIFVSPGCASVYNTRMLSRVKCDGSTLAEDMDLTIQVQRQGGNIKYAHDLKVWTQDPATFTDYHKQILRWYRGFWQLVMKQGIWKGGNWQRVDMYLMAVMLDSILFNRLGWILVLGVLNPLALPWVISLDLAVSGAISLFVAYDTKRLDVVWKFPIYYWIGYLNFYAYFRAMIEVAVLKKKHVAWDKVARYDFHTINPPQETTP